MEKEHFEILLEDVNSKFELILEGLAAFDKKFDRKIEELSEKVEHNSFKIDTLNKKIDAVDKRLSDKIDAVDEKLSKKIDAVAVDLKAHRSDTEAHCGVYRVKEG
jgi:outer membrane murein-binding lipoprotein Lpp